MGKKVFPLRMPSNKLYRFTPKYNLSMTDNKELKDIAKAMAEETGLEYSKIKKNKSEVFRFCFDEDLNPIHVTIDDLITWANKHHKIEWYQIDVEVKVSRIPM